MESTFLVAIHVVLVIGDVFEGAESSFSGQIVLQDQRSCVSVVAVTSAVTNIRHQKYVTCESRQDFMKLLLQNPNIHNQH